VLALALVFIFTAFGGCAGKKFTPLQAGVMAGGLYMNEYNKLKSQQGVTLSPEAAKVYNTERLVLIKMKPILLGYMDIVSIGGTPTAQMSQDFYDIVAEITNTLNAGDILKEVK
jgi:hypothetical protein